jgi:presenilin-like A22 family membrane protease
LKLVVAFVAGVSFALMSRAMRKSWVNTRRFMPISNAMMVICIGVSSALLSLSFSPFMAIALLFVASIYDFWAVRRANVMIPLAKFFLDLRLFPGIAIPKSHPPNKDDVGFALVGGGDIFFIVLVAASFYNEPNGLLLMVLSAVGMFSALVYLFFRSDAKRFYPALPFIFAGLFFALLFSRVLV